MQIIHVYVHPSSFVLKDEAILSSVGPCKPYHFKVNKKWSLPWAMLQQFFFLVFKGWKCQLFVIQFAGYHSFLPCLFARLTGKKSIIIACGTDCVSFPGIGYGNFFKSLLRMFTRGSYRLCSHIAPKHETLWFCEYHYDTHEPAAQGIKAFLKNLPEKYTPITNGYDPEKWPLLNLKRKNRSLITVSGAFEYPFQVQLKGIDLILQAAEALPDYHFTIAGVPDWKRKELERCNVTVLPAQKQDELARLFNEHEYYIQVSMAEGFPNALCEAMLCGCTPIVSEVFSMPEIVAQQGCILSKRNREDFIQVLTHCEPDNPESNRLRIQDHYPIKKRETELRALIKSLIG